MAKTDAHRNNFKDRSFLRSPGFLAALACLFIVISIYAWQSTETSRLIQLQAYTDSTAKEIANEFEIRFRAIQSAVTRLANRTTPHNSLDYLLWARDAGFVVESYTGVKQIAWVGTDLRIKSLSPATADADILEQPATNLKTRASETLIWTSAYSGETLNGFVLLVLDIQEFSSSILDDYSDEFMFQIKQENTILVESDKWDNTRNRYSVTQTSTLQDTVTLGITIYPTNETINAVRAEALSTLYLALTFSLLSTVSVYFAQRYSALSRLNESKFRNLLEEADLVAVILDTQGNIVSCNDYTLALTGYTRDEVIAQNWFDMFLMGGAQNVRDTFAHIISGGETASALINQIKTKSGSQRWIMFNNTIMHNTRGQITGVASLGQDITDQREAETMLRESEARYRQVIAVARGVAYEYDWVNQRYTYMDASIEDYLGYPVETITPSMFRQLIVKNENDTGADPSSQTHEIHEANDLPYRRADLLLKSHDGKSIWMLDSAIRIRNEQEEVVRTIGILLDINDRKEYEQQLKQAINDRETLLQELYHRTKNNMQVIISLLELQDMYADDPRLQNVFQETKNRVLSMSLVHQKLYQSRNLSSIDLADYIRDLTQILLTSYAVSQNGFSVDYDLESLSVLIDTAVPCGLILNEIITNSLTHAYHQSTESGIIHISLKRLANQDIELCVSDEGQGFPEGFNPRLSNSMGMQVIIGIAEHQLQSQVSWHASDGVSWRFQFSDSLYSARV